MKILILSFFYSPDLSAGSFRTTALVKELDRRLPKDAEIDVITTLPNRYSTFTVDVPREERHGRVRICRIALPGHRSGMRDQSRSYMSFAVSAARLASRARYDLVFATSSRLMTAVLGSWIARRQRVPLYLDIRDIFAESIADVLPVWGRMLMPLFSALERFAVNGASRVNLVSAGFQPYFAARYPRQRFSFFTNAIDDEFLDFPPPVAGTSPTGRPLKVVYAGNIGEGQGLHHIVPALASRLGDRVAFRIIGDGGRREALAAAVAAQGIRNVSIESPVARKELIDAYRSADVLFLHLNNHAAFKRVLPSKVFEYAATGKPIWAGVAGYSAKFLRDEIDNVAVFPPLDVEEALRAFAGLDLSWKPRVSFVQRYSRRVIAESMASEILGTASQATSP